MPDSLRVTFDPYLLCLPNPCESLEQIDKFVIALLNWSSLLRRTDIHILIADTIRIALIKDNEYPHHHQLRSLLSEHKCDVADHETICRLTQNIIERTPSFEEFYGIDAILFDENTIQIEPSLLINRLKKYTRIALMEILIMVSIENQALRGKPTQNTHIASTLDQSDNDTAEIKCSFDLHGWSWLTEERYIIPPMPVNITGTIPFLTCYDDLLYNIGFWESWKNATDSNAATDTIEHCINELLSSGASDKERLKYSLGPHFLESARSWGFGSRSDYARLLVESCARIIINIPKNPLDIFHVSSDSNLQRKRTDGAVAFRTHLTKKGAGFRLMLWKHIDGTIEFANVGDKDELIIL